METRATTDPAQQEPHTHGQSRLARYTGTEFVPVAPGEVVAEFVHVFVHGWQPGYRVTERLLAATDDVVAVPAWDPRVVDASGRPLIADYVSLLDAFVDLGEGHAVLWYSWLDESATEADVFEAHRSRQATQVNGRRLAESLQLALNATSPRPRRKRPPQVHLIGHSHGSAVVVHAAVSMQRPPAQLTLLDAPEDTLSRVAGANDLIALVLPRLRPGRGAGSTFVDSYASFFGRPYHGRPGLSAVVDVLLATPLTVSMDPVRAINDSHLYPVEWYARSVRESATGGAIGYGWSPLNGADTTELHPWYQASVARRPMLLHRHVAEPFDRVASRLARRATSTVRRPLACRLDLDARTPRSALRVDSQRGETMIEFDLRVRGRLTGDERLAIDVDGIPAFVGRLRHPVPASGRYLLLVDGRPGAHVITARLTGVDAKVASGLTVGLVNIRLVRSAQRVPYFTMSRSATAVFATGAVAGSIGSFVVAGAGALIARRLRQRSD